MAKYKLSDIEYNKHDVLECELEVIPTTIITDFGVYNKGKQKVDILGANVALFDKWIADDEERETMKTLTLQFNNAKKRYIDRLKNDPSISSNESLMDEKIQEFIAKNNPFVKFFEQEGRDPKPIRNIKVISNKGPKFDDLVAKTEQDRELMGTIVELMKQNSNFMKMMADSAAKTKN